jgi:hypothetical protein
VNNIAKRYLPQIVLAAGLFVVSAGATNAGDAWFAEYERRGDSITPEVGAAVSHNIAVHTIDPSPRSANNTRIDVDGERLLGREEPKVPKYFGGIKGYKENRSLDPHGLSTLEVRKESFGASAKQ